jgi:hypothetical protein
MEPENMSRQQLEARLVELNKKIAEYPHWGAVLTAWEEERRGVERALRQLDDGPR